MKTANYTVILVGSLLTLACDSSSFSGGGAKKAADAKPVAPSSPSPADPKAGKDKEEKPSDGKEGDEGKRDPDKDRLGEEGDDAKPVVPDEVQIDEGEFNCDKGQKGYVGKVYQLPPKTSALPNLDAMTPVGQVDAMQLDVPERKWEDGFPGIPNLIEWFAIKFFAVIDIPEDGVYQFKTHSDDGSKLYLGKDVVVNNDGTHSPTSKESAPLTLKKGKRRIMVEWFQGPRVHIALQVYWKRPGAGYEIIPAHVLTHGKDCKLQDIGDFE